MNFTALWAWRGSRRSCRRLGPEEERSPAAAMERKTLNVRGRWGGGGKGTEGRLSRREGAQGLVGRAQDRHGREGRCARL